MLVALKKIHGTKVDGADDTVGSITDVVFDSDDWNVRYLIVDTGKWIPGRRVLLSPSAIEAARWNENEIDVNLTRKQVKESPDVNFAQPVSRRMEIELATHYGWPVYWAESSVSPDATVPVSAEVPVGERIALEQQAEEPKLRSAEEVREYYVKASDGDVGHVEDLIVDAQDWVIRYVVVDTKNWWPGKKVLIAADWVTQIQWADATVQIDLTKDEIKSSVPYDSTEAITRRIEEHVHEAHDRKPYWAM